MYVCVCVCVSLMEALYKGKQTPVHSVIVDSVGGAHRQETGCQLACASVCSPVSTQEASIAGSIDDADSVATRNVV